MDDLDIAPSNNGESRSARRRTRKGQGRRQTRRRPKPPEPATERRADRFALWMTVWILALMGVMDMSEMLLTRIRHFWEFLISWWSVIALAVHN